MKFIKTYEMYRLHDGKTGKSTPWLSDKPTRKELERLSIDQLSMIAKRKKGSLKRVLIDFLAPSSDSIKEGVEDKGKDYKNEGTLVYRGGKWIIGYTVYDSNDEPLYDNKVDLCEGDIPKAEEVRDVVEKNHGMTVKFRIENDGKGKIISIE